MLFATAYDSRSANEYQVTGCPQHWTSTNRTRHAGTKADGPVVTTNGGRVLAATSFGKDVATALKRSYESLDKIEFEKSFYRSDIGHDVL